MKKQIIAILVIFFLVGCGGGETQLTPDQALEAFESAGLECENPTELDKNESNALPKVWDTGFRCEVPAANGQGLRVFAFADDSSQETIKTYYEGFDGAFGSYVYVNDNLLLQTANTMSNELAEEYREAFMSIE